MLLYKYYPCDSYTFRALGRRGLWAHWAGDTNDPFECLKAMDIQYTEEEVNRFRTYVLENEDLRTHEEVRKLIDLSDGQVNELIAKIREREIEMWAFCALSKEYRDILMWSHYSDKHRGIVVGIEFAAGEVSNNHFQEVRYARKPEKVELETIARFLARQEWDGFLEQTLARLTVKSKIWKKEKEWRIWRKKAMYYNYKPSAVKEVYLGVNCSAETAWVVQRLLGPECDAAVYKMKPVYETTDLVSECSAFEGRFSLIGLRHYCIGKLEWYKHVAEVIKTNPSVLILYLKLLKAWLLEKVSRS